MAKSEQTSAPTTSTDTKDTNQPRNNDAESRALASRPISPFGMLFGRWSTEMDRFLNELGFGPSNRGPQPQRAASPVEWSPEIEVFQRGNELVVRADLPGTDKGDVIVEVTDDALTIQGERREEREEERGGIYRSERVYGSFYRVVPLPEGAIPDSAKATFNNGVLEITLQVPPHEVSSGRRVEINSGDKENKENKDQQRDQNQNR